VAEGGRRTNSFAEALQGVLRSIADTMTYPDSDLEFLQQLQGTIVGRLRDAYSGANMGDAMASRGMPGMPGGGMEAILGGMAGMPGGAPPPPPPGAGMTSLAPGGPGAVGAEPNLDQISRLVRGTT
jgi:hypothetical protein